MTENVNQIIKLQIGIKNKTLRLQENESMYFGKQLKIFVSFLTLVHKMSGLCFAFYRRMTTRNI